MRETDTSVSEETATAPVEPVRCVNTTPGLLAGLMLALVAYVWIMGGLVIWGGNPKYPAPPATGGVIVLLSALVVGFALFFWNWKRRNAIIADKNGLRWRGAWGDWRQVPWGGVRDYYNLTHVYLSSSTNTVGSRLAGESRIETDIGDLMVSGTWTNYAELRAMIVEHATAVPMRAWERKDTRPHDAWPRTFRYWSVGKAIGLVVTFLVTFVGGGLLLIRSISGIFWLLKWTGWANTTPVLIGSGILTLLVIVILWRVLEPLLEAWRRRGEEFTVTPQTFTFANHATGTELSVPWSEIGDYFYLRGGKQILVLRGNEERQVAWHFELIDSDLLRWIVRRYAPTPVLEAHQRDGWRHTDASFVNGSDPRTWQSGAVGIGGRIFRVRDNHIVRWMVSLPTILLVVIVPSSLATDHSFEAQLPGIIAMSFFSIIGWVWSLRYQIETDDSTLTVTSLVGQRRIYWFAIADYGSTDFVTIICRDKKKLRLSPFVLAFDELKREIQKNAPPPQTGFEPREEEAATLPAATLVETRVTATDEQVRQVAGNRER